MRILGIDPGSRLCGYGIIEYDAAARLQGEPFPVTHLASGTLRLMKEEDMPKRLALLQSELQNIIDTHRPNVAAVESVFVKNNPNSALKLGQARGVILATLANNDFDIFEYAPRAVKCSVVGWGDADKKEIQEAVASALKLEERLQADRADALAIALTCLMQEFYEEVE